MRPELDIPSLANMTSTALEFLQAKGAEKGFFLMVEGGRIGKSDRFLPCLIS